MGSTDQPVTAAESAASGALAGKKVSQQVQQPEALAKKLDHAFADPEEARLQAALRYRMDGTCPAPSGVGDRQRVTGIERKSLAAGTPLDFSPGLKVIRPDR